MFVHKAECAPHTHIFTNVCFGTRPESPTSAHRRASSRRHLPLRTTAPRPRPSLPHDAGRQRPPNPSATSFKIFHQTPIVITGAASSYPSHNKQSGLWFLSFHTRNSCTPSCHEPPRYTHPTTPVARPLQSVCPELTCFTHRPNIGTREPPVARCTQKSAGW